MTPRPNPTGGLPAEPVNNLSLPDRSTDGDAQSVVATIGQAKRSSHDGSDPVFEGETCPECGTGDAYERVGPYRCRCLVCGALLKNEEVERAS